MNRLVCILIVVAAAGVVAGGATVASRVRAQQAPAGSNPEQAHDHAEEVHRPTDARQHESEQLGHREVDDDDHVQHGYGDAHEEHDHDEHGDHAGHEDYGEESLVRLNPEDRNKYGIEVSTADSGRLANETLLPGEIVLNEDRVAHIVPRAPGVVREVRVHVGDTVRAGEVMAWLESAELGEAKVDYLSKWAEAGCCTLDLARAQEVHDNTIRLLEILKSSPSLDTLRELNGVAMGENRSILVSAYAELVFAEAAYQREKPLFEKNIASERDMQAAEVAYKKADAMYTATRDSVDFAVRRALLEARRKRQVSKIELEGARRRLFVMGLTSDEITELEALGARQTDTLSGASACDDPNCAECNKGRSAGRVGAGGLTHEAEAKLAWYPLRAPFEGTVIEKHLTLGEKHGDDSSAFTVADLSSVWVNIAVYQRDLAHVKRGMQVTISASGVPAVRGSVSYLAPIVDEKTRTALARVVLPNPDGMLRPGLFVNARVAIDDEVSSVVIPKSAVQRMGEQSIVFLDTDDGFRPTPVAIGRSNETRIEILSGLRAGQRYVAHGAFELKAKIVTSGLGAHAGHGH